MSFLLDADTCIFALKDVYRVRERMQSHRRAEVWVSALTRAELLAGAASSGSPSRNLHAVHHFLHPLTLIDFTAADADACALVRARLQKRGHLIGPLDMLLAAQALARGLTLVTNNEREFRRVQGLDLVNWVG